MTAANVPERVHLIGIGGAHMSAIAQILHAWGHTVSGSDQRPSAVTDRLARLGIGIAEGHAAGNVGNAQLVVTTSAAHGDNPEIAEARRRDVPVIKRAEMVARLMEGRYSIAVAGTHGKTTTSGLIAHMLVEADEYDRAFLEYTPDLAVVLNIEPDHLDIYGTMQELTGAFGQFMASAHEDGHVVACADDPRARELVAAGTPRARDVRTYGLGEGAGWAARDLAQKPAGQTFTVLRDGAEFGSFNIALPGRHNVSNALAGIVTGDAIGVEADVMHAALASYRGAERRFEYIGEAAGVTVMDDYAHHPTEVRTTVQSARERFGDRRLVVLFQPHTYTRTQYLIEEWKTCFEGVDELYIAETYAAREDPGRGLSGEDLTAAVASPPARYAGGFENAAEVVAGALRDGDVFFTVGAGDVNTVGPMVLERLRSRQ
jgi:UDP-N-acetylmuramate--alanine ligase